MRAHVIAIDKLNKMTTITLSFDSKEKFGWITAVLYYEGDKLFQADLKKEWPSRNNHVSCDFVSDEWSYHFTDSYVTGVKVQAYLDEITTMMEAQSYVDKITLQELLEFPIEAGLGVERSFAEHQARLLMRRGTGQ